MSSLYVVQVVVGYKSKPRVRELPISLKKLGKSVSRGNRLAIAKCAVTNPSLRPHIIETLGHEVKQEMKVLSSVKHNSILRMKNKQSLERFTWDRVWTEIQTHCPILASFLMKCLPKTDMVNKALMSSLCVCASILLKLRNPHINLVQGVLSLLLKSGHANTQV